MIIDTYQLLLLSRRQKITEVMTRQFIRKYGNSNYPKFKKLLFGPFEIMRFILA